MPFHFFGCSAICLAILWDLVDFYVHLSLPLLAPLRNALAFEAQTPFLEYTRANIATRLESAPKLSFQKS
jgi:hypothetical protein